MLPTESTHHNAENIWEDLHAMGRVLSTPSDTVIRSVKAVTTLGTERDPEAMLCVAKALEILGNIPKNREVQNDFFKQRDALLRHTGMSAPCTSIINDLILRESDSSYIAIDTTSSASSHLIDSHFRDHATEFTTDTPVTLETFVKCLKLYEKNPAVQFTEVFLHRKTALLPIELLLPLTYPHCKFCFVIPFCAQHAENSFHAIVIIDCNKRCLVYYQPNGLSLKTLEDAPLLVTCAHKQVFVKELIRSIESKYGITKDWNLSFQQIDDAERSGEELFYLLHFCTHTLSQMKGFPPHPQHILQGKQNILRCLEQTLQKQSPAFSSLYPVSKIVPPPTSLTPQKRPLYTPHPSLTPEEIPLSPSSVRGSLEEELDFTSTKTEPLLPPNRPERVPASPIHPQPPSDAKTPSAFKDLTRV